MSAEARWQEEKRRRLSKMGFLRKKKEETKAAIETIAEPVEAPQAPEPKKEEKAEEEELPTIAVKELPKEEVRRAVDSEGNEYNLMTAEEMLTEMYPMIKKIYNTLTG